MLNRFHGPSRRAVAGIKLTASSEELIKTALALSHRTQVTLKFTHVVEPWQAASPVFSERYMVQDLSIESQDETIRLAEEELAARLEPYRETKEFEMTVLTGDPPDAICQDALSSRASLILCAYNSESGEPTRGHTTALTLMSNCSLPVMVFPEGKSTIGSRNERVTILVADDLTPTSSDTLPTAMEFGTALGNADVIHMHVHPESRDQMLALADRVKERLGEGSEQPAPPFDRETFVTRADDAIRQALGERYTHNETEMQERAVTYTQRVAFGPVFRELANAVHLTAPDLIVFGRHHFLHQRPISIGKIPFFSMLNFKTPIMVVATLEHLQ